MTAGEAPQAPTRVCPHCATVAQTAGRTCPFCRRSYRRRLWPGLLVALLAHAALVLAGVALLLTAFGDELERRLDDRVEEVQRDVTRELDGVQDDLRVELRRELDRRLPAGAAP